MLPTDEGKVLKVGIAGIGSEDPQEMSLEEISISKVSRKALSALETAMAQSLVGMKRAGPSERPTEVAASGSRLARGAVLSPALSLLLLPEFERKGGGGWSEQGRVERRWARTSPGKARSRGSRHALG